MFLSDQTMAFGLDISDKTIKLAEIRKIQSIKGEKKMFLTSFNTVTLPPETIIKGEIKNPGKVAEAIKLCLKTVKGKSLSTMAVIASLPETQSYIKLIKLPKIKPDIETIIQKNIKQNFPLDDGQFYYDWAYTNQNTALLAAAQANLVDSYSNVIEQAGLLPIALEPESFSIARALMPSDPKLHSKKPQILMDLGATRSSFIVINNGHIIFTLEIPLSGDSMTKEIMNATKLSFEEAEKIKIKCGLELTKCPIKIKKTLSQIITRSVGEVKKGVQYINRILPDKVSKIYISGGVSQMTKLTSILSNKLVIKVRHANPLLNISLNKKINLTTEDLLKYPTAIGLALAGCENHINN